MSAIDQHFAAAAGNEIGRVRLSLAGHSSANVKNLEIELEAILEEIVPRVDQDLNGDYGVVRS